MFTLSFLNLSYIQFFILEIFAESFLDASKTYRLLLGGKYGYWLISIPFLKPSVRYHH